MPPVFAYILLFGIWVFFACLIWLGAWILSLGVKTRPLSKRLCYAMAGTFPFVIAYQIIATPVVACILLASWLFWRILEPGHSADTQNPLILVVTLSLGVASLIVMLTMSLAGFYEGWRTGWACAGGRPLRGAIVDGPTVRLLRSLLSKVRSTLPMS
jgi:hypothetical protein